MQSSNVLDFEVRKERLTADGGIKVPGKCALVRDDNNAVLGIVGEKFGIIQNKSLFSAIDAEVFEPFDEKARNNAIIEDSIAFGGSICYRQYKFPTVTPKEGEILRVKDDSTDLGFMMTVANGFGGSALSVASGAIDFYCDNGIISGRVDASYSRRHSSLISIRTLAPAVEAAIAAYHDKSIQWATWMKTQVSDGQVSDYLEAVVTKGLGKKLMAQWFVEKEIRGSNAWALFSAMTHYASHTETGSKFATRQTGTDHEAYTKMNRHAEVAKLTSHNEFWRVAA